jgi:N-carbamoyl-L-amino-acid hydrolase
VAAVGRNVIAATDLAELFAGLERIGRSERGTTRLAWTAEDELAGAWFAQTASAVGLRPERDPAGNLWACPEAPGPWWAVGSHLDSVREGGAYDGALGVVTGFALARLCRVPVAVIAFADEEGARYNTPTFGSRALVGALDVENVLARVDERGMTLAEAMRAAGVDPDGLPAAPGWMDRLRGLIELHIDQSRDLAGLSLAAAVVSGLAARMRVEVDLAGVADHAGTTRRTERRDALLAAARLIVRAEELAGSEMVTTAGRILVQPNAPTTVASRVQLWLDARAPRPDTLDAWWEGLERAAGELQTDTQVEVGLTVASHNRGTTFDDAVRSALTDAAGRAGLSGPEIVCFAGHDAGVIGQQRPAGMVLVRNRSGVSHAPAEHIELDDAAEAANLVQTAVESLA